MERSREARACPVAPSPSTWGSPDASKSQPTSDSWPSSPKVRPCMKCHKWQCQVTCFAKVTGSCWACKDACSTGERQCQQQSSWVRNDQPTTQGSQLFWPCLSYLGTNYKACARSPVRLGVPQAPWPAQAAPGPPVHSQCCLGARPCRSSTSSGVGGKALLQQPR